VEKPWFDPNTGHLLLNEYIVGMDSYQEVMEDEILTDDELVKQTERVVSLLQELEATLSLEAKPIATEALCELAVLNALNVKRLQVTTAIPREIQP